MGNAFARGRAARRLVDNYYAALVSPLGAKGAREIGMTGADSAIGNAVYHAMGKRARTLPITIDKMIQRGATAVGSACRPT